jgi:hypothetical protein
MVILTEIFAAEPGHADPQRAGRGTSDGGDLGIFEADADRTQEMPIRADDLGPDRPQLGTCLEKRLGMRTGFVVDEIEAAQCGAMPFPPLPAADRPLDIVIVGGGFANRGS